MSLNPNDPRITAYVFEELDKTEVAAFEAQLAASAELRELVAATRKTLGVLSDELQAEPPLHLTHEQQEAVKEQIERGDVAVVNAATRSRGRLVVLVGLAATLMIAAWVGASMLQKSWLQDRQIAANNSSLGDDAAPSVDVVATESASESPADTSDYAVYNAEPTAPDLAGVPESIRRPSQPLPQSDPAAHEALGLEKSQPSRSESLASRRELAEKNRAAAEERQRTVPVDDLQSHLATANEGLRREKDIFNTDRTAIRTDKERMQQVLRDGVSDKLSSQGNEKQLLDRKQNAPVNRLALREGDVIDISSVEASERRLKSCQLFSNDATQAGGIPEVQVRPPDQGEGPGWGGDQYTPIYENPFLDVLQNPRSTFSIDVDTASYSKVRMYLLQHRTLPRPDAVRIEELVNYFSYDYQPPTDDTPFAAHVEIADCPWAPEHRLARVGIKGREMDNQQRPASNLVFLLDVSGSMNKPNKLPLLKRGMKMLVDQLGENDRVAIAVYASAAGLVLDSTTGDEKSVILNSLDRLNAGGSTNGGAGIHLAYQTALDNFIPGGVNRVILCTDGDFNVGVTGTDALVRLAEEQAKTGIFLSVLGFGMGNHNDSMLEEISNKGNGNYAFIDNDAEARKVLVEQMSGTLVTIAKDVKLQIEFNPAEVRAYRLIGYENRMLATEDFNDDTKDAGEIGAGHTVTALYELVTAEGESQVDTPAVDDLRYQEAGRLSKQAKSGELLTLNIRYKQPDADTSTKLSFQILDEGQKFGQASKDFRFASAVASFGMLLRNSQHKGNATFSGVLETATESSSDDTTGYRKEFLALVAAAKEIAGQD